MADDTSGGPEGKPADLRRDVPTTKPDPQARPPKRDYPFATDRHLKHLNRLIRTLNARIDRLTDDCAGKDTEIRSLAVENENLKVSKSAVTRELESERLLRNLAQVLATGVIAVGGLQGGFRFDRQTFLIFLGCLLLLFTVAFELLKRWRLGRPT